MPEKDTFAPLCSSPQFSAITRAVSLYVAFSRTETVCSNRASLDAAFSTSAAVVPSAMVTASRYDAPALVTHMPVDQPSGMPSVTAEKSPLTSRLPACGASSFPPRVSANTAAATTSSSTTNLRVKTVVPDREKHP